MKCISCRHNNPVGSTYCEKCGRRLFKINKGRGVGRAISDVVFVPRKGGNKLLKVVGVIVLVFVAIIGLLVILGRSTSTDTSGTYYPTPTSSVFPIGQLVISNPETKWVGQTLYFVGVLKNNYYDDVKNISVRMNFCEDADCNDVFDTRYITISGSAANGAYSFSEPVYINARTKKFWWNWRIESAEFNN